MKKSLFFFFVLVLLFSLCLVCHGEYVYSHKSGISYTVPDGWTLNIASEPPSISDADGNSINLYIVDLDINADHSYSESDFSDYLDLFSIDAPITTAVFSSRPFYYARQDIDTKKSLQDLLDELSYEEFVSMFGEHITSFNDYIQLKTEFLGIAGTKDNPYYYFHSVNACALYQSTYNGFIILFNYFGSIDSLSSFESFLNSLSIPVAANKPAVDTYLSDPEYNSYSYDTSSDTNLNRDQVSSGPNSLFEKFVVGALSASVFLVTPQLWNYGKKLKNQSIVDGKIYYGVLYYRFILLCLAGFMSAEMILIPIVGDSLDDTQSIVLALLFSVPITVLYVRLYKKLFAKKHLSQNKSDGEES